jgi:hypothetical protein
MKVLLAPWSMARGFSLRIFKDDGPCWKPEAAIATFRGQTIALKLLEKYAEEKTLTTFNPESSLRMAVLVEIPDDTANRLLESLERLSQVPRSWEIPAELAKNPTLETVERFLAVRKLID